MNELSIFVDESGDFGEYNHHSPYYIIIMFFHNQDNDITSDIIKFNNELSLLGFDKNHCVHNGPIIRREAPYEHMNIKERRHIFNKMVAFTRQLDITFKCIHIEKKHISDTIEASGKPDDYFEHLLTVMPEHMDDKNTDFLQYLLPWSEKLPENCRKSN